MFPENKKGCYAYGVWYLDTCPQRYVTMSLVGYISEVSRTVWPASSPVLKQDGSK